MPADANSAGDIFGGWLMGQMDFAAGNVATRRARGRCVTVAVEAMTFHSLVSIGDEVSIYAEIIAVGRTSMRIAVEAWRGGRHSDATNQVTSAVSRSSRSTTSGGRAPYQTSRKLAARHTNERTYRT